MAAEPHTHDLDGKLHEPCPACDLIRARKTRDRAVRDADAALDRLLDKAARAKAVVREMFPDK